MSVQYPHSKYDKHIGQSECLLEAICPTGIIIFSYWNDSNDSNDDDNNVQMVDLRFIFL